MCFHLSARRLWPASFYIVSILVALSMECFIANAAEPPTLTLQEALAQAMSQSLEAKRAVLSLEQVKIDGDLVNRGGDPKIGLNGTWGTRWQKKTENSSAALRSLSRVHSYGASIGYTIYDFGRQSAKELVANSAIKTEYLAKEEVEEELFWSVLTAYQQVVGAERLTAIAKEQLAISKGKFEQQSKNYRQGLRPEGDVVTAEVDVGRARLTYQAALDTALLARQDLQQLMNPEKLGAISFTVKTTGVATEDPKAWEDLAQEIQRKAPEQIISLKSLAAAKDALQAEEDAVSASTRPTLGANLIGEYSSETAEWQPLRPTASGQIQLSWDIPWNGMTRLSREKIATKKQDIELRENLVKQRAVKNTLQARTALEQAKRLYASLKAQTALVEKQKKLVQDRYQAGQASALELSTAEAALLATKQEQVKLSNSVAAGLLAIAQAQGVRDVTVLQKL